MMNGILAFKLRIFKFKLFFFKYFISDKELVAPLKFLSIKNYLIIKC
jgi:hypothetical protein